MNFSVVFFFFSAIVAVAYANAIDFDRDVDEHWAKFKLHFPKAHHKSHEHETRKANFHKVHKMITAHNAANHSFQIEHNLFSDMHPEEKKNFLGLKVPADHERSEWTPSTADRALPASLDHRTSPCLAPVKNQGSCGSCYTFAAIAPLEFSKCKQTGSPVILSEQQLVDCDTLDGGCNGGWYYNAWTYIQKTGGADRSNTYGYTGAKGSCRYNAANVGARVASFSKIAANANAMMTALQAGPIAVAFNVVDSLYQYRSGVYSDPSCTASPGYPNHAVTCVGYGTLGGQDYWVIRNSWGSGWGIGGYVLIKRGVNMCLIEGYAYSVTAA
jgi:C1A family cysteine protease